MSTTNFDPQRGAARTSEVRYIMPVPASLTGARQLARQLRTPPAFRMRTDLARLSCKLTHCACSFRIEPLIRPPPTRLT